MINKHDYYIRRVSDLLNMINNNNDELIYDENEHENSIKKFLILINKINEINSKE